MTLIIFIYNGYNSIIMEVTVNILYKEGSDNVNSHHSVDKVYEKFSK